MLDLIVFYDKLNSQDTGEKNAYECQAECRIFPHGGPAIIFIVTYASDKESMLRLCAY